MDTEKNKKYRFKVAFSFAGDDVRGYVKSVAESLVDDFGLKKEEVFYDKWHKAELAQVNLKDYLQKIYRKDSHLIIPFFTESYKTKNWCGIEWKAIKEVLESAESKKIMPIINGKQVTIDGISWGTDGYIDCNSLSAKALAELIAKRIEIMLNGVDNGNTVNNGNNKEVPLSFTNRDKELKEILDGKRQYHLVQAPFAYGRTTFIDKLEEEYKKKGWIVKKSKNLVSTHLDNIASDLDHGSNFSDFKQKLQKTWSNGLAILVDLPRDANLNAPELILSEFFVSIQKHFMNLGIALDSSNSRLIIATHRLQTDAGRFLPHLLSEFTYEVIKDSAASYLKVNKLVHIDVNTDCITAKLFYATGGYPNCVKQYLKNFPQNINTATDCISAAENNFANSISPQSRILFQESDVTFYRFLDRDIIEDIRPKSQKGIKVSNIISKLLTDDGYHTFEGNGNPLLSSQQIICDGLMRRVYAIINREKNKNKFTNACQKAATIYKNYVKISHIDKKFSFLWLKEYWFQLLQGAQVSNSLPLDQKEIASSLFLFLDNLDDDYPQHYQILSQQLQEDWEFQFMINFDSSPDTVNCYNPSRFTEFMELVEEKYQVYHQRQGA